MEFREMTQSLKWSQQGFIEYKETEAAKYILVRQTNKHTGCLWTISRGWICTGNKTVASKLSPVTFRMLHSKMY